MTASLFLPFMYTQTQTWPLLTCIEIRPQWGSVAVNLPSILNVHMCALWTYQEPHTHTRSAVAILSSIIVTSFTASQMFPVRTAAYRFPLSCHIFLLLSFGPVVSKGCQFEVVISPPSQYLNDCTVNAASNVCHSPSATHMMMVPPRGAFACSVNKNKTSFF